MKFNVTVEVGNNLLVRRYKFISERVFESFMAICSNDKKMTRIVIIQKR